MGSFETNRSIKTSFCFLDKDFHGVFSVSIWQALDGENLRGMK